MRNPVGFMCVYPPALIIVRKMVRYVDFKRYIAKRFFLSPKNICLYMIFDWLSFFQICCKIER